MDELQQIVESRKEELSKYENVLLKGTQIRIIDGKRYNRDITIQMFLDNGKIKLARVL
jgi:hypothetical protein